MQAVNKVDCFQNVDIQDWHQIKYQQNVRMEPKRNIILQSCSTKNLGNHKYQQFALRQTMNKTGTPLRHKNYEFYSPSNVSPLRFAETHLQNKNNKNKNNHSMNFSSTMNQDQHKRFMTFCDFKQNISNNSPKPIMSKKLTYNKEKAMCQSQNRLLTEPRVEQILFIDHQASNLEANSKLISTAKMNIPIYGVSLQNSSKNNVNKSKVIEDNRMFSNIIKKDQKHNRRHSQSSIGDSQLEEGIQYLRCKNNDGKNAKYKIVSKQNIEEDLFYCTNCTISLVQQGFILQKIPQQQVIHRKAQDPKDTLRQLFSQQLQNTQCMFTELQRKQLQTLNYINKFYNSIIDILSQYQVEDIRLTENYFSKIFSSIEERKKFITEQLLGQILEVQSFNQLTSNEISAELLKLTLDINPQYINEFKKNFNNLLRPKIHRQKQNWNQNINSYFSVDSQSNSVNNQMRFSFEDPFKFNGLTKGQKVKSKIQKMKDQGLRMRKVDKNQKRDAFRDLFPEEQGTSVNIEISSPTFKQF